MSESPKDGDDDHADGGEPEGASKPAEGSKVDAKTEAKADDDAGDGVPKGEVKIPPTRQVSVVPEPKDPPDRPSAEALTAPLTYPDDGPASRGLRKVDGVLGTVEQAVMFAILMLLVVVASSHAVKHKIDHHGWWFAEDVIRGGTFTLAMIGAAYATQGQRHLAMDLISKKLPGRGRLVLGIVLELFTIAICLVLARSGVHQVDAYGSEAGHLIDTKTLVWFLPFGALLISLHAAIHLVINFDYLVRGKTPPERMRSAH